MLIDQLSVFLYFRLEIINNDDKSEKPPQDPLASAVETDVKCGVVGAGSRYSNMEGEMLAVVWVLVKAIWDPSWKRLHLPPVSNIYENLGHQAQCSAYFLNLA